MKKFLFTAATATALLIGGNAHALLVDDFNGGDDTVTQGGPVSSTTFYPNAVGNWRQLNFQDGDSATDSLAVGLGVLRHDDAGSGFSSESRVRWDGNGSGLGPADFTDGGNSDRFRLDVIAIGASDTLLFNVLDSTSDTAELEVTPGAPGIIDVLFSDFDLLTGVVDFSDIFALDLTITAQNGSSVVIDGIQTVVPVPAAVWLFGSGLVALGAVARRRKMMTA